MIGRLLGAAVLALAGCGPAPVGAGVVGIPVADTVLRAEYAIPGAPTGPGVVALHGCGGPFPSRDRQWLVTLTEAGSPVLLPDSFGSRGLGSQCREHRREVSPSGARRSDTVAAAREFAETCGKTVVDVKDQAGFIVNALLFPYLNDAVKMLQAHYASADDIDAEMKVGCGYPMGPFELLDVVGLDVSLAIERELYTEFREPGFAPAPLLEHLVTAGYLGRKTGRGFRDHTAR